MDDMTSGQLAELIRRGELKIEAASGVVEDGRFASFAVKLAGGQMFRIKVEEI